MGCRWAERCVTDLAGLPLGGLARPLHAGSLAGWKNIVVHDPGKVCACGCICVCMCGCICVCMFTPGEGLWVNWCVAGMGTSGPSPLSRAGRNRGGKEGIETHHEIRAMAERNPLCPEGDLASCSSSAPSPSSDGLLDGVWSALAALQLLPCPTSDTPVVLGFLGSSSDLPSVPQEAAGLPLPPPLAWR